MLVEIHAPNSHKLQVAFTSAPKKLRGALNSAMIDALKEISKRTPDGGTRGGLFRFKTPRAQRTGMLAQMFRLNIATGMTALRANPLALRTSVRSTVEYSNFVASRNDFYGRILKASHRDVTKHFAQAIENTLNKLTKSI
ncbi:MAG: hypothetical protein KAT71_08045 [Gammaproteobacteria bacterium]|nr:hypothetical protein [Gammaproteobacteria bacterium]